ncbi:hypothetical protein AWB94_14725 [Mycolicibacterium canariasense]|nr:hypothetical protein AWB94_14725 [Mycolicibacterium canariasense]
MTVQDLHGVDNTTYSAVSLPVFADPPHTRGVFARQRPMLDAMNLTDNTVLATLETKDMP